MLRFFGIINLVLAWSFGISVAYLIANELLMLENVRFDLGLRLLIFQSLAIGIVWSRTVGSSDFSVFHYICCTDKDSLSGISGSGLHTRKLMGLLVV